MIRLYDTLTGDVRPLAQRDEGKVSLYACGPTVYDPPHLGHARQAMTYDVMRRYFEWRGLTVHHVANVTDIDDKIIARARRNKLVADYTAAAREFSSAAPAPGASVKQHSQSSAQKNKNTRVFST